MNDPLVLIWQSHNLIIRSDKNSINSVSTAGGGGEEGGRAEGEKCVVPSPVGEDPCPIFCKLSWQTCRTYQPSEITIVRAEIVGEQAKEKRERLDHFFFLKRCKALQFEILLRRKKYFGILVSEKEPFGDLRR